MPHSFCRETLTAFVADPSPLNHFEDERRQLKPLPKGVVRNGFIKVLRDVLPDVETDDVEEPVTCAFGQPDERPCEHVDFFYREIVFDCQTLHRGSEEGADPVGDEVRRIFAGNDTLAEDGGRRNRR